MTGAPRSSGHPHGESEQPRPGRRLARGFPWAVLALAAVAGVFLHAEALRSADMNPDAGTFLASAARFADGEVLYRDLALGYTPFGVWLAGLWGALWPGHDPYALLLGLVQLFLVGGAVLLALLARRVGARPLIAWSCAVLWIYLAYLYEGVYWVLEPFTVFFGLLAVSLALAARGRSAMFFAAGLAVGAAFLTKQYGLAAALPVGLAALCVDGGLGRRVRAALWAAAGATVPVVLVLVLYRVLAGVDPRVILTEWTTQGYAARGIEAGGPILVRFLWRHAPWMAALCLVLPLRDVRRRSEPWILLVALCGFTAPLAVRSYHHYLLLVAPWALVLGAFVAERGLAMGRVRLLVGLLVAAGILLVLRDAGRARRRQIRTWDREAQEALADAVARAVPSGSRAFVLDDQLQWLNYALDLRPLEPAETGYAFPDNFDEETLRRILEHGDVALLSRRTAESRPERPRALRAAGYRPVEEITGGLRVWRR